MKDSFIEGIESLKTRVLLANIFAGIVLVLSSVSALGIIALLQDQLNDAFFLYEDFHILQFLIILQSLFLLVSFVFVGMWIYRAHANLNAADLLGLEYSPGWAIGWYAIPFANIFKPFQAMRELWNASIDQFGDYEQSAPGILWVWWLGWLFGSLGNWSDELGILDAVGLLLTALSAGALILIMHKITAAQPSMSKTSTFE